MTDGKEKSPGKSVPGRRAPVSVSKFILVLAVVVGVLLLIVNDSVTVENLVAQISSLDSTYNLTQIENDSLQAELKKLSSAERITRIASERLGLVFSGKTLDEITVSKNRLERAERRDARDSTK